MSLNPVTVVAWSFAYLGAGFVVGVAVGKVMKYGHGRAPKPPKRDDDARR